MKAIICAAGKGNRLLPLTKEWPKALVKIKSKTIIEYMLDNFSSCGLTDVIIIVGYKADNVKEKLGTKYKDCCIKYIYNKDYSKSDNLYSLYLSKNYVNDGMIFFNSDILFHKNVLAKVIRSKYPDSFIIDQNIENEEDCMRVNLRNGELNQIGKQINKKTDAQAFGIYRLSQSTSNKYFKIAEAMFKEAGHKNISFVSPLNEILHSTSLIPISCDNYKWIEIDTLEDYERAQKLIVDILKNDYS